MLSISCSFSRGHAEGVCACVFCYCSCSSLSLAHSWSRRQKGCSDLHITSRGFKSHLKILIEFHFISWQGQKKKKNVSDSSPLIPSLMKHHPFPGIESIFTNTHGAFLSALIHEYHCPDLSASTSGFLCNTSCFLLGVTVLYKIPVLWVGTRPEFSNQGFIFLASYLIYFWRHLLFSVKMTGKNNSQRYVFKVKGGFIRMFVYVVATEFFLV